MTVDLDDLDRIEVHDLWSDIVERSRHLPALRFTTRRAPDQRPARWIQVAGALAAAACLAGGLLLARHDPDERQDRAPASSPEASPEVSALPRLAALALPSTVPDGWHLVELSTAPMTPNQETTQPAGQLYRRTSDGAAIRLIITPIADSSAAPVTTVVAAEGQRGSVGFDSGVETFQEAGADVMVQIAGVDDDEAAGFLRQLSATGTGAELRYTSTAPGWVLESSIGFKPASPDRSPYGVVTYRSDDGQVATFSLSNDDPDNPMWRLGVPTVVNGSSIYRLDGGATRQLGPLLISGSFAASGPSPDEIALLESFEVVDAGAWRSAGDQVAAMYGELPTLGRLEIGDVTVTLRSNDSDLALCATGPDVSRCVPDRTRWFGTGGVPSFEGDVNLDGTWVHLQAIDASALEGITVTTNSGPAVADWATTDLNTVVLAAIAPSDATTMSVNAQETASSFWGGEAVRPLD